MAQRSAGRAKSRRGVQASAPEAGRLLSGRVLTYGVIPPRAGPARIEWCVQEGEQHLAAAVLQWGDVLRALVTILPGGLRDFPDLYPLETLHGVAARRDVGRSRVVDWFALREDLERRESRLRTVNGMELLGEQWTATERIARSAIDHASVAYHCYHDAGVEVRALDAPAGEESRPEGRPDELGQFVAFNAASAHALVHRIGEVIGGLFGCKLKHQEDGTWMRGCAVEVLHFDFGFSPGYTARHSCSVCGSDLADCDHILGGRYPVTVSRNDDAGCNVCDALDCGHRDGDVVDVVASPVIVDAVAHEVSLTPRPRDPRARIDAISVQPQRMLAALKRPASAAEEVWDHVCMYPCGGFTGFDALA